ncbi:hypothetical protein ARMGADRAFT_1080009 [Armillaria gallica]|uniref:Uncharacterized protein n=1 Tax=Armillaria gallica TaxID=47427 RepID=A0A2H3E206_ARMGA|nr:hypothetical protein ARMGADRAFT_1080009 [Armillaria gallica]
MRDHHIPATNTSAILSPHNLSATMLPQSTLDVVDAPATPVNTAKREAPVEEGDGHTSKTRIINSEKDVQVLRDRIVQLLKEERELQVKHQREIQALKQDHIHVMAITEAKHQGAINVLTNGLGNQLSGVVTHRMETLGADDLRYRVSPITFNVKYFILRIALDTANERSDLAETSLANTRMELEALQDKLRTVDDFPSMHSYLVDRFGDLATRLDHLDARLVMNFVDAGQRNAPGPGAHGWNRFPSIF